jgi:hypothetical protein
MFVFLSLPKQEAKEHWEKRKHSIGKMLQTIPLSMVLLPAVLDLSLSFTFYARVLAFMSFYERWNLSLSSA